MFFQSSKKNILGFTLIELLVVISIISILSSIAFASLTSARIRARNAYTKQTVSGYISSLELFYNENGGYPTVGTNPSGSTPASYYKLFTDPYSDAGSTVACLGDHPPTNNTAGRHCGISIKVSPHFKSTLDNYMKGTPNPNQKLLTYSSYLRASYYTCNDTNISGSNACTSYTLNYFLEGANETCVGGQGGITTRYSDTNTTTNCIYTSP